MAARRVVVVLLAAVVVYLLLIGQRAWLLMTSGELVGFVLGLGVLLIPVVGAVLMVQEVRFGIATQRLGHLLQAVGGLPLDDVPRRASGRVDRIEADRAFEHSRSAVEAEPESWGAWYRLGIAYDDAGDRRRARAAMRRAIALEGSQEGSQAAD